MKNTLNFFKKKGYIFRETKTYEDGKLVAISTYAQPLTELTAEDLIRSLQ